MKMAETQRLVCLYRELHAPCEHCKPQTHFGSDGLAESEGHQKEKESQTLTVSVWTHLVRRTVEC